MGLRVWELAIFHKVALTISAPTLVSGLASLVLSPYWEGWRS